MEEALGAGAFPSAVLLAARNNEVAIHHAWGAAELDTIFDVASLTKAVVTSTVAMKLYEQRKFQLDVRARRLLAHASGLPAHRPYFATLSGRAAIVRAAENEPLVFAPGSKSLYSDIGFIVLGAALERAGGMRLNQLFIEHVARPLGLADTRFGRIRSLRVAPTTPELAGVVHDDNARAMGGVAGHAGLFSTALDLHRLAASLVAAWRNDRGLVARKTIRRFWRPAFPGRSTWCLGWDTPSLRGSQAGRSLSRQAVGHLGFTGCSIWIDPAEPLWIVLLTNRVYSDPDKNLLRVFRPRIHDAVMMELLT